MNQSNIDTDINSIWQLPLSETNRTENSEIWSKNILRAEVSVVFIEPVRRLKRRISWELKMT
ncbi:hypothetical protein A2U01_0080168, partial [Trifolium medium]|nr:hypothetical protein [Trifolium medium]